jgi:predicted alpha/beta hydrolase
MKIKELNYNELPLMVMLFPSENTQGSILLAPAMGITAQYYKNLASWLSEQGFFVGVLDYQGTGTTEHLIKLPITFNDWVKNIEIAGQWLHQQNPDLPLIFLGHSIGSQLFGFVKNTKLFDKAVFIASSTGYWKDGHSPQKWINYFLLNIILPLSNFVWSYTNAKFFKQGANYPKKPALQWRRWCLNKDYLKVDLNDTQNNYYNHYKGEITSIWFSDDPIANEISAPKLLNIYKRAETKLVEIDPSACDSPTIGHSGFLSRKFSNSIWNLLLIHINS